MGGHKLLKEQGHAPVTDRHLTARACTSRQLAVHFKAVHFKVALLHEEHPRVGPLRRCRRLFWASGLRAKITGDAGESFGSRQSASELDGNARRQPAAELD